MVQTSQQHFRWLTFIVMLIMPFLMPLRSQAASPAASPANDIGFSVAAKIPNNQINHQYSFFDLKMKSGQAETVQTVIYNLTNRDIKVTSAIHTAYTNTNGIIEYVTPTKTYDPSLKYPITSLTKLMGKTTVTVPAKGSTTVSARIRMPQNSFDGVILGGWYFKRTDEKVTGAVKGTTNIKNQYAYVIGMKYTVGKIPGPVLKVDQVKAGTENYHRGIFPYLRNISAVMVPGLTTQTTITSRNSGQVVKKSQQKNVELAPNTVYRYPILTGKNKLQAGDYHLHMLVKNSKHHWVFDKNFTISPAAAKKYNKASVDSAGMNPLWLIVVGALGMLLVMLLVKISIRKYRQWRQRERRYEPH